MSSDLYAECILYNEILKRNPKSIKEMFSATKIAEIKKFISNNGDIPAIKACAETYLITRKRPAPSPTSPPAVKKRAVDNSESSDDSSDDEAVQKNMTIPNGKPMMNGQKRKAKSSDSSSSDSDGAKPTVTKVPAKKSPTKPAANVVSTPASKAVESSSDSDSDSDNDEQVKKPIAKAAAKNVKRVAKASSSSSDSDSDEEGAVK
ncbi:hypothetical protein GCK32_007021, partial [Trichostrongylus colubriformis]